MGVPLSDLVDQSTLDRLRAAASEDASSGSAEAKAAAGMTTAPGGVAEKRKRAAEPDDDERDYVRDGIGQFASTGRRDSAGPVAGGADTGRRAAPDAKPADDPKKPTGGPRRTADGGIDRDGDGDSDPALNADGFAKIGDLDDLNRQVNNWQDNVPPAKRREQRARMLARAAELGASDKMLARIRALPAPTKDRKDDMDPLEYKDEPGTGIEHKGDPGLGGAQVLEADPDTGVVVALVSVTGVEDKVKDIIEPGAYTRTMAEREPIGVWSHDDKTWVARTEEAVELFPGDPFFADLKTMDGKPWPKEAGAVKVRARFNLETPHGAAAFSDVKFFEGKTGWSIGYRATKAARNVRTGVRRIKELDWFEYSPVMVGAASQPMTLSVKSMADAHRVDPDEAKGLFEEAYDELTEVELGRLVELKAAFGVEVKGGHDLIFYANRSTPEVVARGAAGNPKDGYGKQTRRRAATADEEKDIAAGRWVRVDQSGNTPGDDSYKKTSYRPGLVGKGDTESEVKARVRTADGARHYGQPIGSVIIPDVVGGVSDADLSTMMREAQDDEERGLLRQAAALPPAKRRDFLTGREGQSATPLSGGSKLTPGGPAANAQAERIMKLHEGKRTTPANGQRIIDQAKAGDLLETVPDGDTGMVIIKRKQGGAPKKAAVSAGGKTVPAPARGGWDRFSLEEVKPGDSVEIGGQKYTREKDGWSGGKSSRDLLAAANSAAGTSAPSKAPAASAGSSAARRSNQADVDENRGGPSARTMNARMRANESAVDKANADARSASAAELAKMSDDELFDEITKVGAISAANATVEDKIRLAELSNERHRRAETGQGRFGKLKGKTREMPVMLRPGVPAKRQSDESANPSTPGDGKSKGTGLNEHSAAMTGQSNQMLEGFISSTERMVEARREAGDKPWGDDHEVMKMLYAAQDELRARKESGDYNGSMGSGGSAAKTTPRKRTAPGAGEAADLKPSPGGNSAGGFKEPTNDKGETPTDFIDAVLSDLRDTDNKDQESELQAVLDRWKARPNSGTTSALISVLSASDGNGVDGANIDDAIALLEELLKSAAYGGAGRSKKADDEPLEFKGSRASLDRSPRKNWVEMAGGLPGYFREVARSISEEHGIALDRAIPMAIGRIKKWARGGGDVKPDTVAKAAAAVAQWTRMKTQKGYEFDSELLDELEAKGWLAVEVYEGLLDDGVEAKEMLAPEFLDPTVSEVKADLADPLEVADLLARAGEVKAGWWESEPDSTLNFADLLARREALG